MWLSIFVIPCVISFTCVFCVSIPECILSPASIRTAFASFMANIILWSFSINLFIDPRTLPISLFSLISKRCVKSASPVASVSTRFVTLFNFLVIERMFTMTYRKIEIAITIPITIMTFLASILAFAICSFGMTIAMFHPGAP